MRLYSRQHKVIHSPDSTSPTRYGQFHPHCMAQTQVACAMQAMLQSCAVQIGQLPKVIIQAEEGKWLRQ